MQKRRPSPRRGAPDSLRDGTRELASVNKDLDGVDVDLVGRIANIALPAKLPLAPVLEALANSIDSVRDRFTDATQGTIELVIERANAPVVQRKDLVQNNFHKSLGEGLRLTRQRIAQGHERRPEHPPAL